MKQKISLSFDVPSLGYDLEIQEAYLQKDQIIAISKLSAPEGSAAAAIGHPKSEIEVEMSDESAKLPVKHYVITDESGWWTQNSETTHFIHGREALADLKIEDAIYKSESVIAAPKKISAQEDKIATSETEKEKSKAPEQAAEPVKNAPKIAERPVTELLDKMQDTHDLGNSWETFKSKRNVKMGAAVLGLGIGLFAAARLLKGPVTHAVESLRRLKP